MNKEIVTLESSRARKLLQEFKSGGKPYEKEAMDAALLLKSDLIPSLLSVLDRASSDARTFILSADQSLAYAAILLAYWEVAEAFPYFANFAYLDEKTLDELWGDMVTQDFQRFLFRTGKFEVESLKKLVNDQKAYVYVRTSALGALNWCVAEGLTPRDEIYNFLKSCMIDERNDSDFRGFILNEWLDLFPKDDLDFIEMCFKKYGVNESAAGSFQSVKKDLDATTLQASMQRLKKDSQDWQPTDVHEYSSWWAGRSKEQNKFVLRLPIKEIENEMHPLAGQLHGLGTAMRFHEVRAYVLGAVMGIELLPPSEVLTQILQDKMGKETAFKNLELAKQFHAEFFNLWNALAGWSPENRPPILDSLPSEIPSDIKKDTLGLYLFRRRDEADRFLEGLIDSCTDEDTIVNASGKKIFRWIETYLDDLNSLCSQVALSWKNLDEESLKKMEDLLRGADLVWPKHFKEFDQGLKQQRLLQIETDKILRGQSSTFGNLNPKIGRNDPCHCGSGEKYKKCCLH